MQNNSPKQSPEQHIFYCKKMTKVFLIDRTFYTQEGTNIVELKGIKRENDPRKGAGVTNNIIAEFLHCSELKEQGEPMPPGSIFTLETIDNFRFGSGDGKFFNIFANPVIYEQKKLYHEFAEIQTTDEDGMIKFLTKYGALHAEVHTIDNVGQEIYKMSLVIRFIDLLEKKSDITQNTSDLRNLATEIYRCFSIQFGNTANKKLDLAVKQEREKLKLATHVEIMKITEERVDNIIRSNINRIRPDWRRESNNISYLFWDIPDLLSAMYYMLAFNISNNYAIRTCRYPSCSKYFTVSKTQTNKFYCCEACRNNHHSQKSYAKKKAKAALK